MSDEAKQAAREMWDLAAARWERRREIMWGASRTVGEWLVDQIDPKPGDTVLELAAGPGDTGFLAAQRVGPSGRLISTDLSAEMLAVGRRRAASLKLENVEFRVMDAERLDLPSSSVDHVLCRWGLMLMPNPEAALKESSRVLRPGGGMAFALWDVPERNPWATVAGRVVRSRGHEIQGDPFGPGGLFSLANRELIRDLLAVAGLDQKEVDELEVLHPFRDFGDYWAGITDSGPIADVLRALPGRELAEIRDAIERDLSSFASDGGYLLPGVTILVAAESR